MKFPIIILTTNISKSSYDMMKKLGKVGQLHIEWLLVGQNWE